MRQEGI